MYILDSISLFLEDPSENHLQVIGGFLLKYEFIIIVNSWISAPFTPHPPSIKRPFEWVPLLSAKISNKFPPLINAPSPLPILWTSTEPTKDM